MSVADDLRPLTTLSRDLFTGRYAGDVNYGALRELKSIGEEEVKQVIGRDMTMRNFPRRGRPIPARIRYDIDRGEGKLRFLIPGMFGIIEGGTSRSRPIGAPIAATARRSEPVWLKHHAKQISKRLR